MDNYGIDSHKLMYHPERVAKWLRGENISPIVIEMSPVGVCNHRCVYCAFDYLKHHYHIPGLHRDWSTWESGHPDKSGNKGPLISETYCNIVLEQAAAIGVKAIVFAGEGEPFMHPSIHAIIAHAKVLSLDVGVSTNGSLRKGHLENSLPFLDWIRFSLDAATVETHTKIHRCPRSHFSMAIENIRAAVEMKRRANLQCVIGVQMLLLPENQDEVVALTDLARGWGVDYLTIKPFSKHPLSHGDIDFNYEASLSLGEELQSFSTKDFKVIFRTHTMERLSGERPYTQCLGLPFATYLATNGDVYTCSAFLGNKDFVYGNIYDECFPAIWEGKRRQEVLKMVAEMGVKNCREICHLDEINRYLWHLAREPLPHVNFI